MVKVSAVSVRHVKYSFRLESRRLVFRASVIAAIGIGLLLTICTISGILLPGACTLMETALVTDIGA